MKRQTSHESAGTFTRGLALASLAISLLSLASTVWNGHKLV
jgi:hypothetical protein